MDIEIAQEMKAVWTETIDSVAVYTVQGHIGDIQSFKDRMYPHILVENISSGFELHLIKDCIAVGFINH